MRSVGQLKATSDQLVAATDSTIQRPHNLVVAAAGSGSGNSMFIDIGNSIGVAPEVEEECVSYAVQLMTMLQRVHSAAASTNAAMPSGPIEVEDVLVHLLSHLEPADLAYAGATCAFWRLAARQVVLSSPWLSRSISACGIQLQVAGELGVAVDVDYAALEPFHDGQPSGTGLRCLRSVVASEVIVEYAGIALPACPSVSTYALGLEVEDVRSATDALMNSPYDYRIHPDVAETVAELLRVHEEDSPGSLDPYEWHRLCRKGLIAHLQFSLPRALDARVFGNVSRFIKDERDAPNCAIRWTTASILAGQPHAYVVALQDIAAGCELSIDYGEHYDRHWVLDDADGPTPTFL